MERRGEVQGRRRNAAYLHSIPRIHKSTPPDTAYSESEMVPRRETLGGLQGGACVPSKEEEEEEEDREGGVIVAFQDARPERLCMYVVSALLLTVLGEVVVGGGGGFLWFRLASFILSIEIR